MKLPFAILSMLCLVIASLRAEEAVSIQSIAINTNAIYAVAPAGTKVTSLAVVNDTPHSGTVKFYLATANSIQITNALAAGASNILVTATNTLEVGAHLLICGMSSGTARYQRAVVHSVASDGIVITNYPGSGLSQMDFALAAGDSLWRMTNAATLKRVDAGLTVINGGGIIWGDSRPSFIEVAQTGLCTNLSLVIGGYR